MSHVNRPKFAAGFTLIEVMVAVSIFTIVITVGIGALVTVNNGYQQTSATRQSMSAVSSALEFVTRQLRTSTTVYCGDAFLDGVILSPATIRNDCYDSNPAMSAISFINQDGEQVVVAMQSTANPDKNIIVIKTSATPSGVPDSVEPLTDVSVIDVDSLQFHVSGLPANDALQPTVVMIVQGTVIGRTQRSFALQTSVTPRTLDTPPEVIIQ